MCTWGHSLWWLWTSPRCFFSQTQPFSVQKECARSCLAGGTLENSVMLHSSKQIIKSLFSWLWVLMDSVCTNSLRIMSFCSSDPSMLEFSGGKLSILRILMHNRLKKDRFMFWISNQVSIRLLMMEETLEPLNLIKEFWIKPAALLWMSKVTSISW